MPGPNLTGKPRTRDYVLGRGIIYFSLLNATTGKPEGGYRDLGNAPDFAFSVEGESLDHEASRAGLKQVDRSVTIRQKASLKFSLDELSHENIALFVSGSKLAHVNVAIAGFTVFAMVPDATLELGKWYDIINASGERAYDVQSGDLTVTTNEATPVSMVLNTDYELDSENGRIFVLSTSTVAATAIVGAKGIRVALAANVAGNTVAEVNALTATSIRGAVKFVGANAGDGGKPTEYEFASVSLTSSGDLSLISDEWVKMEFSGTAESGTFADGYAGSIRIRTVAAGGAVI